MYVHIYTTQTRIYEFNATWDGIAPHKEHRLSNKNSSITLKESFLELSVRAVEEIPKTL